MTFVLGSYQAVERPGGGHRASTAGLWRGEDLRNLNEVAMTVLPADCADGADLLVDSLAGTRHPHLLPVIDLVQDSDRMALVSPWPTGGRLAELVLRRGSLSAGETLTVLIPLAAALGAVHAAGVRHGGLCPETIWFDPQGRPLLGALAVSHVIADLNDGMPAGCRDVAPEVVRREKKPWDAITLTADVFSMGSVALFCLTGRSAWPADDPADVLVQSAAGLWPDPGDEAGPGELIALVREMLDPEPARRPGAAGLVPRLARAGEPAPIVFASGPKAGPSPVPASADRWRGWSAAGVPAETSAGRSGRYAHGTRAADGAGTSGAADAGNGARLGPDGVDRDGVGRDGVDLDDVRRDGGGRESDEGAAVTDDGSADRVRSPPRQARRRWSAVPAGSASPRRNRLLARAGIPLLVGALIMVIGVQVGGWWTGSARPGATTAAQTDDLDGVDRTVVDSAHGDPTDGDPTVVDPTIVDRTVVDPLGTGAADVIAPDPPWPDVVAALDAARGRALDAADPALLADVYLDTASAAGAADAAIVTQLASRGLRVVGGVHQIISVTPAGAPAPDAASGNGDVRLAVVDTLPSHPVIDAGGRQVGLTAARAEQRRVLVVRLTGSGYRISNVEPG